MFISEVTRAEALTELADRWDALHAIAPAATPYTAHAWALPWLECFATPEGGTPRVLIAGDGDKLLGLAPLYQVRGTLGRVPVRRLQFIGHHMGIGDFLCAPDRGSLVEAFVRHLVDRGDSWDAAVLEGMPTGSRNLQDSIQALVRAGRPYDLETMPVYVRALHGEASGLRSSLADEVRARIEHAETRLAARGAVELETHAPVAAESVDALVDRCLRLRLRSPAGATAAAADPDAERFFRAVCRGFAHRGRLELDVLRCDGQDVAFVAGLVHGDTYWHIDEAQDAKAEVDALSLLTARVIERNLATEGRRRYANEGVGADERGLTDDVLETTTIHTYAPTARGRAAHLARTRFWPGYHRVRGLLGR